MSKDDPRVKRGVRHRLELFFSLYVAFLGVSLSTESVAVLSALCRMECRINAFLHVRQTDFVRGYFALWIPSVAAAVLIWSVLRVSARTRLTEEILRSLAGIVTIVGPFAFWVDGSLWAYAKGRAFWPVGWIHGAAPFEMATAATCTVLFLSGRWKLCSWATSLLLAAHYAFWYFGQFNPYSNHAEPFGPAAFGTPLGLCAALTWGVYVRRLREAETPGRT